MKIKDSRAFKKAQYLANGAVRNKSDFPLVSQMLWAQAMERLSTAYGL